MNVVDLISGLVRGLLPPSMRPWGEAAIAEANSLDRPGDALPFLLGCLSWAVGEAIRFQFSKLTSSGEAAVNLTDLYGPRSAAIGCGIGAVGLGLAYLAAGGAPASFLMVNAAALAFGLVTLAILVLADRRGHLAPGPINLLLGLVLMGVSLWGVSADGVTRWLALGPLAIQPGMMIVPLMVVLFARSRDVLSLGGVALAALALALQPDRGMSGALAAGLTVLAFTHADRRTVAAAVVSIISLGAALVQADPSPAVPFVDRILYSSFGIHPLAGAAVLLGSVLLVVPALAAIRAKDAEPSAWATFGAVWAAIILAAALGNYPTPVVGYGGSAVVGYFLSLIVFSRRRPQAEPGPVVAERPADEDGPLLFAGPS
jgi:cell division protein FtsW (lipid II flippase)